MKSLTKISYKLWMILIFAFILIFAILIFILNYKIESTFDIKIKPQNNGTIMSTSASNIFKIHNNQEMIIKANKKIYKVIIGKSKGINEKTGLYDFAIKIPPGESSLTLFDKVTLDATVIYDKTTVGNLIWDI